MTYKTNLGHAIGIPGLDGVYVAGTEGAPWLNANNLPNVTTEAQPGEIVSAWDTSSTLGGGGEFIFLAVPTSTTVTAGLFYSWDGNYRIIVVPTAITSQAVSGFPIALAINAVASNASSIQWTFFQIQGRGTALKTAVQVVGSIPIYVSGTTAGRVKVLGSAFRAIIGARTANTASVTSTTSTVAVYLHRPSITAGI